MLTTRHPAVAGIFYPAAAGELEQEVRRLLAAASAPTLHAKALIAPHAGYMYSGPIAATAYAALRDWANCIRQVVLLGPSHRVPLQGLALPDAQSFATPLGRVMLDVPLMRKVSTLGQVQMSGTAHALEHSLEVQLPFLQCVLDDFTLLPLAVGSTSAERVAEVLEAVWDGEETLIVISSDLSHYLPYRAAQAHDQATVEDILALQPLTSHEQACGATPVNGLLLAARRHGLTAHLLDLRNSGDTAGSRDSVVGYAAIAFTAG